MPIGAGLPSPATPLFNRLIRALLPQIYKVPININADSENYKAFKEQEDEYLKGNDTPKDSISFSCRVYSSYAVGGW